MLVDCAVYADGRRAVEKVSVADAARIVRDGRSGFTWVGLHEPTALEFEEIAKEFGLHELAVEDAIKAHQRPKIETFPDDTVFVVLRTARYVDSTEVVDMGELMLFLGEHFVVSVRHGQAAPLSEVREQLESHPDQLRLGPGAVLHAVLDRVVDEYERTLLGLTEDVDQVEDAVLAERGDAGRIYQLRRELSGLRRAVEPLSEPLLPLTGGSTHRFIDEQIQPYFRDVHDHVLRATDQVLHLDRLLESALDANLSQATLQLNSDQRKISAWAAIGLVPTIVGAIYGMNFEHMPELEWTVGYPLALGIIAVVCFTLHRAFKRSGWL